VFRFHFRGFASLLLSAALLVVALSGLLLWLGPPPPSRTEPWLILGIGKGAWKSAHIYIGLLMVAAAVVHLILNWSLYSGYLWNRPARRPNQVAGFALALAIVAGVAWASSLGSPGGPHPSGHMGPGGPGDRPVAEKMDQPSAK
jgi:hypothetical protein